MQMRAFLNVVGFIPRMFEAAAVGLEVFCDSAVVACSLVVPGGVCIDIVWVIVGVFSLSTLFRSLIVHFAVHAYVLLVSIFQSVSLFPTMSAMATVAAEIFAMGLSSCSSECSVEFCG